MSATLDATFPTLVASGETVDPAGVGLLRDSSDLLDDADALRARMADEGYLYLPGLLGRDAVLDARREVTRRLMEHGFLVPGTDPMDAVANPEKRNGYMPEVLARDNAPLMRVLYDGPMIALFERLLGEPVRHYDYTWFRSVPPGRGTPSHCDVVYMGRGERERLYTAWTPIGDVDFAQGGLMVLERSNTHDRLKQTYGQQDVDSYCENKPNATKWGKTWGTGGSLKGGPNKLRRSLGGTWRTSEYRAGDVLVFSVFTVHASLDNRSDRVRLSSDSRYQPATAPADERWIGPTPIAHGAAGRRGRIC
jgi:ectoine hydroxylase-related dioxygenase (phytanoyl-CoA dioxygenase family)